LSKCFTMPYFVYLGSYKVLEGTSTFGFPL
jgi:hypothetical protein